MSTISKALKDAGIAPPVNKRIWQWLKDQGPHTGAEVAVGLNVKGSVSSSMLSQMAERKMVNVEKKDACSKVLLVSKIGGDPCLTIKKGPVREPSEGIMGRIQLMQA